MENRGFLLSIIDCLNKKGVEKVNNPEKNPEEVYVEPTTRDLRNHPQSDKIRQIFVRSEENFFRHLSDLFVKEPEVYAKVEEIIFDKFQLSVPSLLEMVERKGENILRAPVLLPEYEEQRKEAVKKLYLACRDEAETAIFNAYHRNGYCIAEIVSPSFNRLIEETKNFERRRDNVRFAARALEACLKNLRRDKPINLINFYTKPARQGNDR